MCQFVYLPFVSLAGVSAEIHAHSISWGFTGCRFLGYHDDWAGPSSNALLDDSCMLQCLDFLLNPAVMLKRQSIRLLPDWRTVSCVNMHSNQVCTSHILAA